MQLLLQHLLSIIYGVENWVAQGLQINESRLNKVKNEKTVVTEGSL